MFSLNETNRFLIFSSSVDLRKGVNTLCGVVSSHSCTPTDGRVYVFLNRTRSIMKLLHWERGGYVVFYKRMELGRISRSIFQADSARFVEYRWDQLVLLMEGISPSAHRRKRFNLP